MLKLKKLKMTLVTIMTLTAVGVGITLFGHENTAWAVVTPSCRVPLRNVLVDDEDCQYYETAFRMMATDKISVNSYCTRGAFKSAAGRTYKAQVVTRLKVQGTTCNNLKPFTLNPILLSKPNCENLRNVVSMLSTGHVSINPSCEFGKWTGADGAPRSSMVKTAMRLRANDSKVIAAKKVAPKKQIASRTKRRA